MQTLKYYVLGTQNSELLKVYLEKYYKLLLEKLYLLEKKGLFSGKLKLLLSSSNNKKFILDADISSIINFLYVEVINEYFQDLGSTDDKIYMLNNEIDIFLKEGIDSENLIMNKGTNILGTNIKLTNLDNNPYNGLEAHPEHQSTGGVIGWGDKGESEWLNIYEKTFALLKTIDLGIYYELNQIITKIIPLGTSSSLHNSASYKEAIGHLYMGYTLDTATPEINNLEAIIHESSHNKLNLLMQFDPIILNDKDEKYYSAIRPDARPIHGVFLGYHAFAPTMYIIMKAYKEGHLGDNKYWLEKIVLYHIKTKFLQKVIKKYAQLTELGKDVSNEIDSVILQMDILFKEMNPPKNIILTAKKKQIQHFNEVNKNYPNLEY